MKPRLQTHLTALLTQQTRNLTTTIPLHSQNRIFDPIRTPPTFHDYLRLSSANNTLFLALFTQSSASQNITPLLSNLVRTRAPKAPDRFAALAFTEVELDSADTSNGSMRDLELLWGVNAIPTLIGFGGRRADRVTERLSDTGILGDKGRMEEWVDRYMARGDEFPGGGEGKGLLGRIFG